jgi:hypothetical protein
MASRFVLLVLSGVLCTATAAWGARKTHPFPDEPLYLACPPVSLAPAALPPSLRDAAYAWNIPAFGGKEPVRLMVTGGSLPPGLSLSPGGALSGTPKGVGSFVFSVSATDSCKNGQQSATHAYRLVVADSSADLATITQSVIIKGPLTVTAVASPAAIQISAGRAVTTPVRYQISAKPADTATLTSPGATFRANGTVIGSVPAPLVVALVNGSAEIAEAVTISSDILERARREDAGKIQYSRPFIGRGTTALAVIEITLPAAIRK